MSFRLRRGILCVYLSYVLSGRRPDVLTIYFYLLAQPGVCSFVRHVANVGVAGCRKLFFPPHAVRCLFGCQTYRERKCCWLLRFHFDSGDSTIFIWPLSCQVVAPGCLWHATALRTWCGSRTSTVVQGVGVTEVPSESFCGRSAVLPVWAEFAAWHRLPARPPHSARGHIPAVGWDLHFMEFSYLLLQQLGGFGGACIHSRLVRVLVGGICAQS